MQPILTTIALIIGVAIALRTALVLTRASSPAQVRRTLGVGLIVAGVVFLYLRAFALAVFLLFVGTGLALRKDTGFGKAAAGRTSQVRSMYLEMTLDHDSGKMDGRILTGVYQGRLLSELGLAELFQLATDFRDDAESVKLLETYLDSAHSGWRESADADTNRTREASSPGGISRDQAYRVLGLEPGAGEDDIREAYHRLIKRVHPDRGGSAALAAQINEAKDRLLGGH